MFLTWNVLFFSGSLFSSPIFAHQAYMAHIQCNAEQAVRQLLRKVARERHGSQRLLAEDWMDDGTPIRLAVQIDQQTVGSIQTEIFGMNYLNFYFFKI